MAPTRASSSTHRWLVSPLSRCSLSRCCPRYLPPTLTRREIWHPDGAALAALEAVWRCGGASWVRSGGWGVRVALLRWVTVPMAQLERTDRSSLDSHSGLLHFRCVGWHNRGRRRMHRTDAVRPCTRAHVCAHRHTEPDTSARGMHIQDRGTDFSFMTVQSLHTDTDRSGSPRRA